MFEKMYVMHYIYYYYYLQIKIWVWDAAGITNYCLIDTIKITIIIIQNNNGEIFIKTLS